MAKFLILFLVIFSNISFSEDIYSINEFIEYLKNNHSTPKIYKSDIDSSYYQYNSIHALTDWEIKTSVINSTVSPYETGSLSPSSIKTFGTTFSIGRPLLSSGGLLSLDFSNTKTKQTETSFRLGTATIPINKPLFYENSITLSYTQPLLYGFLGETLKHPILIASTNVKTTKLNSVENFEQFILQELSLYIDWVYLHEVTELSFGRLQLARESKKEIKKRVQVNVSEKIDLLRAEFAVQRAHQQWLTQKANLKSMQYKLATRIEKQSIISKKPNFDLYEPVWIKKPDYIVIDNLRAMKIIKLNKPILKNQLNLSEKKRYGTLDLIGQYDFHGGNTEFTPSLKYLQNNSSILLNYSRPLTDTQTIEDVKENKEQLFRLESQEKQLLIDLKAEVTSLYTLIEEHQDILESNLTQILIAQEKADAEKKLYNQGRSTIDLVIQSQDNVLNAKLSYASLSATYQKHILAYLALTDQLLQKYNIKL